MNREKSDLPAVALWLLRHFASRSHREALTGDLVETFREGRSAGWVWRQVLTAVAAGLMENVRQRSPLIRYATAAMC
jgi:hypothetical protein